jgi:Tfp pilus assembly protein PilN
MSLELTNLLPANKIRAFKRLYFIRLITVVLFMSFLVLCAHTLLLLPSYLYSASQADEKQKQIDGLNASLQTTEEKEAKSRVATLQETVTYLGRLEKTPVASDLIRAVLQAPHEGVRLSGFTVNTGTTPSTTPRMGVSGIAASRDSLRLYVLALEQLPFVTSAELPISAYAKDSEIPFTISLSGPLVP